MAICPALLACLWAGATAAGSAPAPAPAPADGGLYQEARQLRARYVADVQTLAAWCDAKGLTAEAKKTRAVLAKQDPYKLYLPVLGAKAGPPGLPASAGPAATEWQEKFLKLRRGYAADVFDLSKQAIRRRQHSLAYMGVLAAIREDPDNEAARRVLGYQKYQNEWRTAYEVRKLRAGMVWHEKFGWLTEANVARYEKGERFTGGRWVTAQADAALHEDIRNGWDVETEHYLVRTNHSIEQAVGMGVKLENLFHLWQQLFLRYYASESFVDSLFTARGPAAKSEPARLDVVLFRDQADYVRTLRPVMPNVAISQGVYIAQNRKAYFFAGSEDTERVMYHEATHQLFQQTRRVPDDVGRRANFWIIEGIGMYMESLHQEDGFHVLGGLDDERMNSARYHLLKENYYVPFAQVTSLGMTRLQSEPTIRKLYSQLAAMTHFLIHYDGGRYRDATVSYVIAVYAGNDDRRLLSQLTGASYEDLDRQYREFMQIGLVQDGK